MTLEQIATGAIDLFLEYRDKHEYGEDEARTQAIKDTLEGLVGYTLVEAPEEE